MSSEFDQYAVSYDDTLNAGLSFSGEKKEYYAAGRIAWLKEWLRTQGYWVKSILDYGCGTGGSIPYLLDAFTPERVLGIDVSEDSIALADTEHRSERTRFSTIKRHCPDASFDLVFCNGVFHHIPPAERAKCLADIYASLKPGGVFAIWENNPWNPGTRFIMSRVPFDRDAITINPLEMRKLLRQAGFATGTTDFLFIFPRFLSWFRPLERLVSRLPLGGQYLTLARKPF